MSRENLLRGLVLLLLVFLGGCSGRQADFCRLLTTYDVGRLHSGAVSAKMEEWYKSTDHPTWYCSWKDGGGKNLLSLSVSFATAHSSTDLARTYSGGSRVAEIPEVGKNAAAIFYKSEKSGEERLTLLASNHKWSLDIRSPIEGDESGEQFQVVKELANKVFANLATDPVFAKLKK